MTAPADGPPPDEGAAPGLAVRHVGPTTSRFSYWIGWIVFKITGWKVEGRLPMVPKMVLIAAPHTSNWDLVYMLGVAFRFRLRLNWLGKHTLFETPLGPLLRWLGGIPVDRRSPQGTVGVVAELYHQTERLVIAIPPSGTRGLRDQWKSGFYHIARAAGVPIVCTFLDYSRKVGGVGPALMPTDDIKADMNRVRAFYDPIVPKFPDKKSTIRIREEDPPDDEVPVATGTDEARAETAPPS